MDIVSKFKDIAGEKWKTKHAIVLTPTAIKDDVRSNADLVQPGDVATFVGYSNLPGRLQRITGNLDMEKFQLSKIAKLDKVIWSGLTSVSSLMALEQHLELQEGERFYLTFVNKSDRSEPVYRMLPTVLLATSGDIRYPVPMAPVKERPVSEGTYPVSKESGYVTFRAATDRRFKPNRLIVEADDYDGLFVSGMVLGKENVLPSKGDVPAAAFSPAHTMVFEMSETGVAIEISIILLNLIASVKRVKVTIEGMAEG